MRSLFLMVIAALLVPLAGCGMGMCVREGTLIATPAGDVPIEALKVGAEVWTMSPEGVREVGRVNQIHRGKAKRFVRITSASGHAVETTPTHLIAVPGGWARAGDLESHTRVLDEQGAELNAITESIIQPARVFDLSVTPNQNYFAGGILVHNKTIAPPASRSECTGAFGFINYYGGYEQVLLESDGTGTSTVWVNRRTPPEGPTPVSCEIRWGVDYRTIEICCIEAGKELWRFKGEVRREIQGDLRYAGGKTMWVTLLRPGVFKQMIERGGLPEPPKFTESERKADSVGEWAPPLPSRR